MNSRSRRLIAVLLLALGLSMDEVKARYPGIVEFSERRAGRFVSVLPPDQG